MKPQLKKSKLLRIAIQVLFWTMVFLFPLHLYDVRIMDPQFYKREFINDLFLLALFYFNINYLIPRFFIHKKLLKYFLCVFAALLVVTSQHIVVEKIYNHKFLPQGMDVSSAKSLKSEVLLPPQPERIMRPTLRPRNWRHKDIPEPLILGLPEFLFFMIIRKALTISIVLLLMGSFYKLSLVWFNSEREKERLQKDKLNAELKFLKSQVNPHFLFNSLNSLYVLAHKKSEKTEESVLKLSQIMRYMLYDTNVEFVPLSKEIEYLHNYIDLQKLRLPEFLEISFLVEGVTDSLRIEPMLLIPFIENAFKHGISYSESCKINILINIKGNQLILETENKVFQQKTANNQGGIGLVNVKERLNMLYNNKHELAILKDEIIFKVKLQLQLNKI